MTAPVPLMRALLRALPPHAAVLLVGDVDQLPSVGLDKRWQLSGPLQRLFSQQPLASR